MILSWFCMVQAVWSKFELARLVIIGYAIFTLGFTILELQKPLGCEFYVVQKNPTEDLEVLDCEMVGRSECEEPNLSWSMSNARMHSINFAPWQRKYMPAIHGKSFFSCLLVRMLPNRPTHHLRTHFLWLDYIRTGPRIIRAPTEQGGWIAVAMLLLKLASLHLYIFFVFVGIAISVWI